MPLNAKGRKLIQVLTTQHGLKFRGLSQSGILHYSLTDKARVQHFKSTLRKYKLHYRSERTQEAEETGVYTLKIRTEREHQIAKLRRKQLKGKKKSKGGKDKGNSSGTPRALGLLMAEVHTASFDDADIRKELGLSIVDWDKLQDAKFAQFLQMSLPPLLTFRELVDECQWFFDQLHEHELSTKLDGCRDQLSDIIQKIADRLSHDASLDRLKDDLYTVQSEMDSLYSGLRKITTATVNKIVEVTHRPKHAFVKELTPYWGTLSEVWNDYHEVLYPLWDSYVDEMVPQLSSLQTDISIVKEAATNRLVTVKQMLKKSMNLRNAEELDAMIHLAKEESLSSGQVPALTTTNGGWMVYKDDCPAPEMPTRHTSLTDRFAYCKTRENGKKCPAFDGVHGENVICKAAGTHRHAAFFSLIAELTDDELLSQLNKIARDDSQILSMFKISESRDGKLYYARISDDRISVMLDRYPSSKRVGVHSYTVYHVAGEPLLLTNELAITADRGLLEDLDKGTPMSRVATVRTAAVLRLTFTSNARMDTNFLDYMRKLNALKITENTWDVPFKQESDKERILTELECDFGYPIQLFQIVENPDLLSPRQHDLFAMAVVANARVVSDLTYDLHTPKLRLSDRLYDVAAQSKGKVSEKIQRLAANLRVSNCIVVARADEVLNKDGFIGVPPSEGSRILAEDGQVVEIHGGELLNTNSGESVNVQPASLPSEAQPGSSVDGAESVPCITIKLTPEAFSSLMSMFGVPFTAQEPEPEQSHTCTRDQGCTPPQENTPGNFVTFSPDEGPARPKITFLTPEAQAKRSGK